MQERILTGRLVIGKIFLYNSGAWRIPEEERRKEER
jgi:hypothetical protein